MKANLDIRKLRAFQIVAKHQSLRRAAATLHLSVPAISIQMRLLEEELNVKLLERVGNRMMTTPAGTVFSREVDKILLAVDDAIAIVSNEPTQPVPVSLSIGTDLAKQFSDRIAQFIRHNKQVDFVLRIRRSQETLAMVEDGTVDLGIGFFEKVPPTLAKKPFRQSGFALAFTADHPLSRVENPTHQDVAHHRLIILQRESDMGRRLWRAFAATGIEPASVLESGNCHLSLDFAAKKLGVALVHGACLAHAPARSLRTLDFSPTLGQVDIAAIWRRSRSLSAQHQALLNLLSAEPDGPRRARG